MIRFNFLNQNQNSSKVKPKYNKLEFKQKFSQRLITQIIRKMLFQITANSYLIILILMELGLLTFCLLGGFSIGLYFIGIRIFFLIMAQCCKQPKPAAFYSVLALMNALYTFDPVGLFLSKRFFFSVISDSLKTLAANIFCTIACLLAFAASYLGYHYKLALEKQISRSQEVEQGEQTAPNPLRFLYNGNNSGYANPNISRDQNSDNNPRGKNFQPFQGQGYSLS